MKRRDSAALLGSVLLHLGALSAGLHWAASPSTPAAASKGRQISLRILPRQGPEPLPKPLAVAAPKNAAAPAMRSPPRANALSLPIGLPKAADGMPAKQAGPAAAAAAAAPAPALEAEAAAQASRPPTLAASPSREPAAPTASATPSPGSALVQASLPPDHQPCLAQITERFYPSLLRERGLQALVTLLVQVDEQGRAAEIKLKQGSGLRLFDEAAHKVARACRFTPARLGEQAIASWVEYPVRFALKASPP